jgi:hypothetical protein
MLACVLGCGLVPPATAQLKGHYIPGFTGLQNGTQAPPGASLLLPLYWYTSDEIRDDDGNSLGVHPRVDAIFTGLGLAWVTNLKLLGANVGGSILPVAFLKSRIEGASLDVPGDFAFTDITVQPLQLGWHSETADFVASYSFFIPTGKWELGGDDNAGLGMWSHDFQLGSTVWFDEARHWNFATLGTLELHSHKKDTDIKVGNILTLEGGLGRTFYKVKMVGQAPVPTLVTNVGVVYYGQAKLTDDTGPALTPLLDGKTDIVYGAGVEGSFIFPESGLLLGLRAVPEFGAKNRTTGWTVMLTIAWQFK